MLWNVYSGFSSKRIHFFFNVKYLRIVSLNKMFRKLALLTLAASASAIELTPDTWDEQTAGKNVFVKFFAPWCGHCKAMKPAWDSLMTEFEDSDTVLIADVDCIGDGKALCEKVGVKGFPTIKHGDPSALEDYKGARDLDALKNFAGDLKPLCNVATHENCDDDQKDVITGLKEFSLDDLESKVKAHDGELESIEKTFATSVQELQAKYEQLNKDKEISMGVLKKSSNIGLVKGVIAHKKSAKSEL